MDRSKALTLVALLSALAIFGLSPAFAEYAGERDDTAAGMQEQEAGAAQPEPAQPGEAERGAMDDPADPAREPAREPTDPAAAEERPEHEKFYTHREGAIHSDDLIGQPIINRMDDDEAEIGRINGLVIGEDGQVEAVVVGVGGFLGIGQKDVALSWDAVEHRMAEDTEELELSVELDADELRDAPEYGRDEAHETAPTDW